MSSLFNVLFYDQTKFQDAQTGDPADSTNENQENVHCLQSFSKSKKKVFILELKKIILIIYFIFLFTFFLNNMQKHMLRVQHE